MQFKRTELGNGLNIIGEVNPAAVSAAVGFFVKAGSRDEDKKINGVTHFLEHMLFKGTERLGPMEVNQAFDRTGAQFNAATSEENTIYYAAVLPEYLEEVTRLWCELLRPALRTEDFEMEKNVIKEEIAMYKDDPHFDVVDRCRELHFGEHPCGLSVLGTEQSIDGLSAGQMHEYFGRRYSPNNMTLVCAGNFDWQGLCRLAEQGCGRWARQDVGRTAEFTRGSAEKKRQQRSNLVREHICLMSPAVSAQDERRYAASLLAVIVGDEVGSRFFWELVDTALAETATLHYEGMDGVGLFYSYIRCAADKAGEVTEKLERIFAELAADGVSEEELAKAKNKVLSAVTLRNEVPMGRLVELGSNWTYLRRYVPVAESVERINAVTTGEIAALVEEFDPGRFTQYSLGPASE